MKHPLIDKIMLKVHEQAIELAHEAHDNHNPQPMTVTTISGEHIQTVSEGVCGFAWVHIKANNKTNRAFINALKRNNLVQIDPNNWDHADRPYHKDTDRGGFQMWVNTYTQSMERKQAFARAYSKHLAEYGIDTTPGSRMD